MHLSTIYPIYLSLALTYSCPWTDSGTDSCNCLADQASVLATVQLTKIADTLSHHAQTQTFEPVQNQKHLGSELSAHNLK